ncbi:MAG TPA: YDG domain-containing protein [Caulobacteraceae bacterium]
MDRTFRLVWNDSSKTLTMADGWFGGSSKRLLVRSAALAVALSGMWGGAVLAGAPAATALPTGAQVAAGQVAITTTPSTMNVVQASSKAVINWQSFDVGADAAVNFSQPGKDAVALNRVLGHDPSAIYGKLTANGQVFLINPNGVLFAPGAQVNVGALVASTMDISDQDFLAGTYRFNRDGSSGAVVNEGALSAGYVALLGSRVSNGGVISAPMGTVALASGEAVTLGITGQNLVSVQVDKASIDTLVRNNGLIQVAGGVALLSAQSATDLLGQVVNTGEVVANGIESDGGTIRLTASSSIEHAGVLSADAGLNGTGGSVSVIAALDNPASLTRVSGAISARGGAESGDGGSVETSASRLKIADTAHIDTTAPNGATGAWLLDPYDFTIAGANGDITGATLSAALASSDVIIATADTSVSCTGADCGSGDSSGNGDIHVNDAVNWSEAHTLTLSAWNNVNINAPISVSGSGGLALEFAQSDIALNFPSGNYFVNAPVNLAATASFSTKAGSDGPVISYTVITDSTTLAALSSNLGGAFVLGDDVDLSAIASWTPLGTLVSPFAGYFDGLGHEVTGLTHVNSGADTEVGLFGANVGQIQNVGVTGANVAGSQNVGALVGFNNGFVVNSYATGFVTGSGASSAAPVGGIGGLIGYSAGPIFQSYANVTVSATSGDQSSGSPLGTFVDPHGTGGIGGLTGVATSGVTASYATGAVTGNHAVGGLVGYSAASIQSTYSTGLVTGATVNAIAASDVGGLIGAVDQPSSPFPFIFSSFWDVETSGQATSAEGLGDAGNVVGLTTAQMKTASTFTGDWVTSGVWELRDGQYPLLKQMLQPIFVIANNKTTTYNGSAVTDFNSTIAPVGLGSNYAGTVTVTPSTADPTNAGSYTLTASGLSLVSPDDQHGYRLVYVDGVLTIDPATLTTTITGVLQGEFVKTYDGDNIANGLTSDNFLLSGWAAGEGATVTETQGLFDDANAGTGKTITVALTSEDFTAFDGTDLSNYVLPDEVHGDIGTINQKAITATAAADDKTYDGDAAGSGTISLAGLVEGDYVAPSDATWTFEDKNAGTDKAVTISGATLIGDDAGNYTVTMPTSALADILQKAITASATADDKTYDGDTTGSGTISFTGVVEGDAVSTTGATWTFEDKNAGTDKTVTISGATLTGDDAGNYTVTLPTSALADILQKAITASATANDKTYDGDTAGSGTISFTGVIEGDAVTTTGATWTFDNKNAGADKTVTISGATLSGDDAGNYSVTLPTSALADILQKAITASATANDKTYDGDTAGSGTISFTGVVEGDVVSTTGATWTFDNKNAGTDKTVTISGATLSGDDAGNYTVTLPTSALADILQKAITASATANDKTYDGDTAGSGTISFTGVVEGDVVSTSGATWTFEDKNAGADKTVSISGATLAGDDAGNYSVTLPTSALADILQKAITASATANDKTYDGNTIGSGTISFTGVVEGDAVSTTGATWTFEDKNAGADKAVTISGATLSGDDAGNYSVTLPTSALADITKKALDALTLSRSLHSSVTPDAGSVALEVSDTIGAGTAGLVEGDGPLTISGSALWDFNPAGPPPGGNKPYYPVTLHPGEEGNLELSGEGADNYTLTGTSVSATIEGSAYPKPSVSSIMLKTVQFVTHLTFTDDNLIGSDGDDYIKKLNKNAKKKRKKEKEKLSGLLDEFSDDLDVLDEYTQ